VAPQESKIVMEILQSINNRTQSLREIAYAWLLLTYIVINTLLGRLTLDPAGMHCPWWDDAFVSSYRQDAAKRQPAGIVFTQYPKINILPPSGKTMN